MAAPSFDDQVRLLETFLGRELPGRVRELFRPGCSTAPRLLALATGREFDLPTPNLSPGDAFAEAQAKFDSVLGHAIGNAAVARFDPNNVWPHGLLVVEDCGCAIYRAIDLDSPKLRVIEYEHFEPVSDPRAAVGPNARLAYSEPDVPEGLQHQFVVVAATLDNWLDSFAQGKRHPHDAVLWASAVVLLLCAFAYDVKLAGLALIILIVGVVGIFRRRITMRRTLVILGLGIAGAFGLVVGTALTAPIVGWPHAFPGLLMDAPESLRAAIVYGLMICGPIAAASASWMLGLRAAWKGKGRARDPKSDLRNRNRNRS